MVVTSYRAACVVGTLALGLGGSAAVADVPSTTATGPSTTVSPYVLPAAPG